MSDASADTTVLPFDEIGGAPAIRTLVDRFYDLMDGDDRFAGLRAIHAVDLTPMRESLAGFLTAWLGGPRDWFEINAGTCIMSAHRQLGFGAPETEQWLQVMGQALADTGVPVDLADRMNEAFERMGRGMQAG
jgi:hemoglobin